MKSQPSKSTSPKPAFEYCCIWGPGLQRMNLRRTFQIQTIISHTWPPKAHVYLTMQNAFSLSQNILKVLTVQVQSLWEARKTLNYESLKIKKQFTQSQPTMAQGKHSYSKGEEWSIEENDGTKGRLKPSRENIESLAPCLASRAVLVWHELQR
jgi:hypothetical protein